MPKKTSIFLCKDCGNEFGQWHGKCPACSAWDSLVAYSPPQKSSSKVSSPKISTPSKTYQLHEITLEQQESYSTGFQELDRVLGGGVHASQVILLAGQPGTGKSTLLLKVADFISKVRKVAYISGEESLSQTALRAKRLQISNCQVAFSHETKLEAILSLLESLQPDCVVIDSIQMLEDEELASAAGSVQQIKHCSQQLISYAKQHLASIILVGHITKDGQIAGPKVLEHMVDTSLFLDSLNDQRYRTLRAMKNRFGSINEMMIMLMMETGLREVTNPSAIFLSATQSRGSCRSICLEGTKAYIIETQALVQDTNSSPGRLMSIGVDSERLQLILAICAKHLEINLFSHNIFINVVGGFSVNETAIDLAVLVAIIASIRNNYVNKDWVIFGELGLGGEVRPVPNGQQRVKEALKQGFSKILLPKQNMQKNESSATNKSLHAIENINDVFRVEHLFTS